MKKTCIVSLFAAVMSVILAAPASAVPASKRIGPATSNKTQTVSGPVAHNAMKYVGPRGKGYVCSR